MNGQSTQAKQTTRRPEYEPQWQEAKHCSPHDQTPCKPKPPECKPERPDVVRERDSKETFIFLNNAESTQKSDRDSRSADAISKLTWALLGLASLLFLGSMLMMLAYGRSTNTTTIKEITNNTNKSREVIRVEADEDSNHYYYPQARW